MKDGIHFGAKDIIYFHALGPLNLFKSLENKLLSITLNILDNKQQFKVKKHIYCVFTSIYTLFLKKIGKFTSSVLFGCGLMALD